MLGKYPMLLVALLLPMIAGIVRAADDDGKADDEKLLEKVKQDITADGLCDFFRKRIPSESDLKRVPDLIKELSSDDFETREKAVTGLVALGPSILPRLRKEKTNPDAEVRVRIESCIEKLHGDISADLAGAAARLVRDRKPKDGIEVLLAYLPYADDPAVEADAVLTLYLLGTRDNKVDSALAAAVKDTNPARRSAAVMALARAGSGEQKKLAEAALKDSDAIVRCRAAAGMLAARDKSAVPVLIDLLGDASQPVAELAEETLARMAGEAAPSAVLGSDADSHKTCRTAWEAWWKKNGDGYDLAKADVEPTSIAPAKAARDVSRKLLDAWMKSDVAIVEKLLDETVMMDGEKAVPRADIVAMCKQKDIKSSAPKYTLGEFKTVKIEDLTPRTKAAVESLGKVPLQCVQCEIMAPDKKEVVFVIVRMRGGKAVVVGLGER